MLTINLNHENDKISDVLGISKDQLVKTKAAMIFSILSPKILGDSLFDDENEMPANMKTKSGSIEIMLSHCNTDEMKVFSLLNFFDFYDKIISVYYMATGKVNFDELLEDEKDSLKKALKMVAIQMKIKPIQILIDNIKDANGNFDKFYDNVKENLLKAEDIGSLFSNLSDDDE